MASWTTNQPGRTAEPGASTHFQFLTFTNIEQTTQPRTRRQVRSHVMHQLQQSRKRERQTSNAKEIVLDTSSLVPTNPSLPADQPCENFAPFDSTSPGSPDPHDLGAGRSNPFVRYPIDMGIRTHELLDHLHGDTCPMFKTLSRLGFFQLVEDEAGFRQILCTSSSHMASLRNEAESSESIKLNTEVIRSVNNRLADPIIGIGDGVIVTIVALACHAVMCHHTPGLLAHFSGLEEIIRRRGGLSSLRSSPILRIMIFWLDINTAFVQDRGPRFACPSEILPSISSLSSTSFSSNVLLRSFNNTEMAEAVRALCAMNAFMVTELSTRDLWTDGLFAGYYIMPVLFMFLSLSLSPRTSTSGLILKRDEACRIAIILYIARIRRNFGVNLAVNVYLPKLKAAVLGWDASTSDMNDQLLLWVLIIGGVQSFGQGEHQWFVRMTVAVTSRMSCSSWYMVTDLVRDVLWVESTFETDVEEFQKEISANWENLNDQRIY